MSPTEPWKADPVKNYQFPTDPAEIDAMNEAVLREAFQKAWPQASRGGGDCVEASVWRRLWRRLWKK